MRFFLALLVVLQIVVPSSVAGAKPPTSAKRTPLDEYVQKPDAAYGWKVAKTIKGNSSTTFIIRLTSQTWRDKSEVDRPLWEHWLVVVKPEKLKTNKAFLAVGRSINLRPLAVLVSSSVSIACQCNSRIRCKVTRTHSATISA